MINYYYRFIPHAPQLLTTLCDAFGDQTRAKKLEWNNDCDKDCELAFASAKDALPNAVKLDFLSPVVPLISTKDASNVAVGAVLLWQFLCKQHLMIVK